MRFMNLFFSSVSQNMVDGQINQVSGLQDKVPAPSESFPSPAEVAGKGNPMKETKKGPKFCVNLPNPPTFSEKGISRRVSKQLCWGWKNWAEILPPTAKGTAVWSQLHQNQNYLENITESRITTRPRTIICSIYGEICVLSTPRGDSVSQLSGWGI